MGYTTEFQGQIKVEPPLSTDEVAYLSAFAETRRMDRANGPYYVDGTGFMGQGPDSDVLNQNRPPNGQPGLWCCWRPTEDGEFIEWDGSEKFYHSPEWMTYLIDHFLKPGHIAPMPFLGEHTLNGVIKAQGEEMSDRWKLVVEDNEVRVVELE